MSAVKNIMKNYAKNAELDEFLQKELTDAGYGGVDILKTPIGTRVTVFVTRPGLVIGRRGMGIRDLTTTIEKRFGLPNPQISVLEVEVPELNPRVMANRISQNVARGGAFRRAALWALNSIMNAGAMGVEITIRGKLRSERAHYQKYRAGIILKSGEIALKSVKEATTHLLLKMGLYGIKVRIALKNVLPPEVEILEKKPEEGAEKEEEASAKTEE